MSDKYILHYFGANGRAINIRAILSAAKANWEDKVITMEEWPKLKPSGFYEFGNVPVLEYKGKKYCQRIAIELFLLKQFNLYGKNPDEQYQIDSLLCSFDDLIPLSVGIMFCQDPKKKEELVKNFEEKYKFYLNKYEQRYLALGKGKYFLGDHFSGADIFVAASLPGFCKLIGKNIIKDNAPNLDVLIERLKKEELKEFHEKYFR
jgi:glutathione S-transferase